MGLKGKQFLKEAHFMCRHQFRKEDCFASDRRIYISVAVFAPDRRKRDLDNLGKVLCDFLTHAGICVDDSQIDWSELRRMSVQPGAGRVIVTIEEISETP
jgi:Holliday junction resolvase RusA-like endonuclease